MEDHTMTNRHDRRASAAKQARERDGMRQLCELAGLDESEMCEDPEHDLLISASGMRKLCAIAPDQALAQRFSQWVTQLDRLMGKGKTPAEIQTALDQRFGTKGPDHG
jgi:hypothetical protein